MPACLHARRILRAFFIPFVNLIELSHRRPANREPAAAAISPPPSAAAPHALGLGSPSLLGTSSNPALQEWTNWPGASAKPPPSKRELHRSVAADHPEGFNNPAQQSPLRPPLLPAAQAELLALAADSTIRRSCPTLRHQYLDSSPPSTPHTMHQHPRAPPRASSPASPQSNPARTNNPREGGSAAYHATSTSSGSTQSRRSSLVQPLVADPSSAKPPGESVKKLDQILQVSRPFYPLPPIPGAFRGLLDDVD